MNKKIKLAAALGSLTTASIAITAFTLPQFNSLDSYLFRPTNWTEAFASKKAAIDFINDQGENFFREEVSGTRTVNQYAVTAALNGLDGAFFQDFSSSPQYVDESNTDSSVDEQYQEIREYFLTEMANHLATQIAQSANNVHIPTSDLIDGSASIASEYASDISTYYLGASGLSFETLEQAFASLVDQSQIVFDYNGVSYNTVDEVIAAWMSDSAHNFTSNDAFKEIHNHISHQASGMYTDSYGHNHQFYVEDNNPNNDDADLFKAAAEAAFYNEMVQYETWSSHEYTTSEWEVTSEYESVRDAWMAANTTVSDPFLNEGLLNGSMASAFGYLEQTYWPVSFTGINGPAADFFSYGKDGNNNWWQKSSEDKRTGISDINNVISNDKEFADLSLLGILTTSMNGNGESATASHWSNNIQTMCADNTSNKDSNEWKEWTMFAEFMGFDKLTISNDERALVDSNTVNRWYELDCEGSYSSQGIEAEGTYEVIDWFSDSYLSYFNMSVVTGSQNTWKISNYLGTSGANDDIFLPTSSKYTFGPNTMNGSLNGKTMVEALLEGGSVASTEDDYKNSGSTYTNDFRDWVSTQDFIIYWGPNVTIRGITEKEAIDSVNAAIKTKIENEWININYTTVEETTYDISDSHVSAIRAIDPSFNTKGYTSIEQARLAVESSITRNGNNNAWFEKGIVKFMHDDNYLFDTSKSYNNIQEAWDDVSWPIVSESIVSASGQSSDFFSLIEYTTNKYMMLSGFNGSTEDFIFDMSVSGLSNRLISGFDLSHLDSNIDYIDATVSDMVVDESKAVELITYRVSLTVDYRELSNTVWFETAEFIGNSEDELKAIEAAEKELIQYWINYINA